MKFLRTVLTRNLITLIAGLAFLNLGFLQFEFSLLELNEFKSLVQNVANNCFEEEQESGSQSSEEDSSKEAMEFSLHHHEPWTSFLSFSTKNVNPFQSLFLNPGYKSTFSPPPEVSLL